MNLRIRPIQQQDLTELIHLTLLAFEPIFTSFAEIMGKEIYPYIYPDWMQRQRDTVLNLYETEKFNNWVAELDGQVVGLIAYELFEDSKTGQVEFLVVHPEHQKGGIGTKLNEFALQKMKEAGMEMAVVGTGGDESHKPARKSYEKAGYTALPLVRFYKKL